MDASYVVQKVQIKRSAFIKYNEIPYTDCFGGILIKCKWISSIKIQSTVLSLGNKKSQIIRDNTFTKKNIYRGLIVFLMMYK